MLRSLRRILLTAAIAAPLSVAAIPTLLPPTSGLSPVEAVDVAPRAFTYRRAGEFNLAGQPVDAPLKPLFRTVVLHIMRSQVTAAEYDRCVVEAECAARSAFERSDPNMPAVQVSWHDATDYAHWLSARTGQRWRLPTDEEWVFAAGTRFHDDALLVGVSRDPSVRWLARYEKEAGQESLDRQPRPTGTFGMNEFGLFDLSGNVWEWTNSCFIRQSLDANGSPLGSSTENCGVRVVEGEHRAYVTDFVRDASNGGCSAGQPPSNLGFRLVREDSGRATSQGTEVHNRSH